MRIKLDPTKQPVKSKVRRYTPEKRRFLNTYVDQLVQMGFLVPSNNAQWQSAPNLVPKQSRAQFRTKIDLRPVNAGTESEEWHMQNPDAEMQDFEGHDYFASVDFVLGYWQLPLHPESYDKCGIVCPNGIYFSTRVLHGLQNAAAHFQSSAEPLFSELRKNVKVWIDDFNLHAFEEEQLLNVIERFVEIAAEHNLYISVKKSSFFAWSIIWCGRIIEKDGYRLDPSRAEGIRNMEEPQTTDELCQFVHCDRWMPSSIPDFGRTCAPLNELLEKAYDKAGKRKKRSIKNMKLSNLGW